MKEAQKIINSHTKDKFEINLLIHLIVHYKMHHHFNLPKLVIKLINIDINYVSSLLPRESDFVDTEGKKAIIEAVLKDNKPQDVNCDHAETLCKFLGLDMAQFPLMVENKF